MMEHNNEGLINTRQGKSYTGIISEISVKLNPSLQYADN